VKAKKVVLVEIIKRENEDNV